MTRLERWCNEALMLPPHCLFAQELAHEQAMALDAPLISRTDRFEGFLLVRR